MHTDTKPRNERLYIDGEWCEGDGVLEVTDRAAGGTFAEIAAAGPDEAEAALAAAHAAQTPMRGTTPVERASWLEAIADEIEARADELTEAIVREAGKPISSASGAPASAAERFRIAATEARDLATHHGEYREGATAGHEGWRAVVKPEPIGTVLCVSPYNYPLVTAVLQIAPALAAGNSIVLKPASETPVTAAHLTDAITAAVDLPDGAFNFVPGRSSEIGDVLASDDRVDTIAMTGSSRAGKQIANESGIVNLHMELGGNAPAIVFPDADLDAAADACAAGSFRYAGQRCSAISRVLAHESVHDDVVERIEASMDQWTTGSLFDESTNFGPLVSEDQAEWVETLVEDAVDRGAELICGGDRDGAFFEPTLLADVPRDARILYEEQFGPVAAVTAVADADDAVSLANADDLGLDAAVFTSDHDRAMAVAERINAGGVRINGAPSHGIGDVPYGGNGDSGIGREGIHATIESMLRKKSIVL